MRIISDNGTLRYYDVNGREIHEGDTVKMCGRLQKVYRTEEGTFGTDATNPKWIMNGKAFEGEYGIYPFEETDEPEIVR